MVQTSGLLHYLLLSTITLSNEAGNSTSYDHESSSEYWNWYGYPPYSYYPYNPTFGQLRELELQLGTRLLQLVITCHLMMSPHRSGGESSHTESVSTNLPPSQKEVRFRNFLGHIMSQSRTNFWQAYSTVRKDFTPISLSLSLCPPPTCDPLLL